ncbi:hypothetical protein KUM39_04225 [Streptomyces sp. J2-1]|uniref:hypothetical protein n=1 Tax=Streptomyces corallincola TaxID=2851888 RepID=UPI001C37ECA1|nr:hypothetical protein [Streptomyces corallincola]MBV2353571.1 hypothetical protein [Streptomyces corallincola]
MGDNHHKADLDRVNGQNSLTDVVRTLDDLPPMGPANGMIRVALGTTTYGRAVAGQTDFGHRDLPLNRMIDLVEQTDPEDLESSGKALWDARDAIASAAEELRGHIDKVEWVGDSGSAFRDWGAGLVTNTTHLSEFAGAAGDQISAAAVGLSSVRSAMPARDTEANRKRPDHFTADEKTTDKAGYTAAVRVEKDRQEAINQMNRLASYYAVSEEVLSGLPAKDATPTFTTMPDVGVPPPKDTDWAPGVPPRAGGGHGGGPGSVAPPSHHALAVGNDGSHTADTSAPPSHVALGTPHQPDAPIRTHIDTAGTLPSSTSVPVTGHTPPVAGAPAAGGVQPPFVGGPLPTASSGRGLNGAKGLNNGPLSARGRAGGVGSAEGGARATGRASANQVGRATAPGESLSRGLGAKPGTTGQGVTGGAPRPGGVGAPRGNGLATGAGRSNGVIGGRPTSTTGGPGSRIPRGTVIGREGAPGARPASGRPVQRGVLGAPEGATGTGRSGTGTSGAVTGKPTSRTSAANAERKGLTRGGAGLVRGPGRKDRSRDEETEEGAPRPDYLVEDEETHLPENQRRDVPPVVN